MLLGCQIHPACCSPDQRRDQGQPEGLAAPRQDGEVEGDAAERDQHDAARSPPVDGRTDGRAGRYAPQAEGQQENGQQSAVTPSGWGEYRPDVGIDHVLGQHRHERRQRNYHDGRIRERPEPSRAGAGPGFHCLIPPQQDRDASRREQRERADCADRDPPAGYGGDEGAQRHPGGAGCCHAGRDHGQRGSPAARRH